MIELHDATYMMQLGGGKDVWRLTGKVYNHPNFPPGHSVFPSVPKSFNEDILTTLSGSQYRIVSYFNRERVVKQINKDIANNGYELY